MQLSVYRPHLSDDFLKLTTLSKTKGAIVTHYSKNGSLFVTCLAWGRKVGTAEFSIVGDGAHLVKRHIIEKDFYPMEAMISHALKSLRKRKVKMLNT